MQDIDGELLRKSLSGPQLGLVKWTKDRFYLRGPRLYKKSGKVLVDLIAENVYISQKIANYNKQSHYVFRFSWTKSKKTGDVKRVEKFATTSLEQFELWWQCLKDIKQKIDEASSSNVQVPEVSEVASSLGLESPALLPGESIICGIPGTSITYSSRDNATWTNAMCWITNFCLYLAFPGTSKRKFSETIPLYDQIRRIVCNDRIPVASVYKIEVLPPKGDLDFVCLSLRDFRSMKS